mmetsp:Transcript_27697/g.50463  ORF Transcript_27697/g.50463 Transcript_27697/m.50463 type:complete len:266 (+) Transcript_27697:612-1409(+)
MPIAGNTTTSGRYRGTPSSTAPPSSATNCSSRFPTPSLTLGRLRGSSSTRTRMKCWSLRIVAGKSFLGRRRIFIPDMTVRSARFMSFASWMMIRPLKQAARRVITLTAKRAMGQLVSLSQKTTQTAKLRKSQQTPPAAERSTSQAMTQTAKIMPRQVVALTAKLVLSQARHRARRPASRLVNRQARRPTRRRASRQARRRASSALATTRSQVHFLTNVSARMASIKLAFVVKDCVMKTFLLAEAAKIKRNLHAEKWYLIGRRSAG